MKSVTVTTSEPSTIVSAPVQTQVGLGIKFIYGVGDLANAIKLVIFGLFTLFFYTTVMGLSGTLVGIASTLGLVWDAVVDPYIGHLSDRVRSRLGRRHIFMFIGSATMGVSLWLFLSPPQNLSTTQLFLWLLVSTLLVRTTTSIYSVPYYALGAELSADYHERTTITGIRALLTLVGTMAAAALSFVVFFPDGSPGVDPKLNYAGYPSMGLVFGVVMTLAGLLAAVGTMRVRNHHRPHQPDEQPLTPRLFFAGIIDSLRVPAFRIMFVSFSLFYLALVVNSALSIHYLTYQAGITESATLSSFQAAFYAGGIGGALFWLLISRWVDKRWLYLLAGLAAALILCSASFLLGEGRLFGVGNVFVLQVGHALGGWFGSIVWILPWSMMADIADADELRNGKRREGLLVGVFLFGQQLAAGLSVLLTGILVDSFAGLVPGQSEQAADTANRLGLLFGVLPAVLIGIAMMVAIRYPLTKTLVKQIQTSLTNVASGVTAGE